MDCFWLFLDKWSNLQCNIEITCACKHPLPWNIAWFSMCWILLCCLLYLKICSCKSFQESIAAEFLDRLVKWCKNIKISDPFEEGCRLGPVVSKSQVCILVTSVFLDLTIPSWRVSYIYFVGFSMKKFWSSFQQQRVRVQLFCVEVPVPR